MLKETNAGGDFKIDRPLFFKCQSFIDSNCKGKPESLYVLLSLSPSFFVSDSPYYFSALLIFCEQSNQFRIVPRRAET